MDETNKKYKPDDDTRMDVDGPPRAAGRDLPQRQQPATNNPMEVEEDLSIEELEALVQNLRLARETADANLKVAIKQKQYEEIEKISEALKDVNERLEAAQSKMISLGKGSGGGPPGGGGPPNYDILIQNIIDKIVAVLPDPSTVKLSQIEIGGFTSPTPPPTHPSNGKPFLHLKDPVDATDMEIRVKELYEGSLTMRKIVFAASASGKTWLALQMLKKYMGYFFVAKDKEASADKNPGSIDVVTMIRTISTALATDPYSSGPNAEANRDQLVTFASQCLAMSRMLVLYAWTMKYSHGNITPEMWLLIQLFPTHFCDGHDIFSSTWTSLFVAVRGDFSLSSTSSLVGVVQTRTRSLGLKVCVIDEAQILLELHKDQFKSKQQKKDGTARKPSLRPLLSPILNGIQLIVSLQPIIMGTGMSMLNASKMKASGGIATSTSAILDTDVRFMNFPSLSQSTVLDILKKELGNPVHEGDDKAMELASRWLWGRHGWVSEFVVDVLESQFQSPPRQRRAIAEVLKEYIQKKTVIPVESENYPSPADKFSTPAKIIEKLKAKQGGLGSSAAVAAGVNLYTLGYNDFAKVAWIQVHGLEKGDVERNAIPRMVDVVDVEDVVNPERFIEAGLSQGEITPGGLIRLRPFEPLILEAYRQCLVTHASHYLRDATTDSDKGKRLEMATPLFRPFMTNSTRPVMAYQCAHGLKTSLSPSHDGVWRAVGARFGREGITLKDAEGFYRWFAERVNHLKAGTSDIDETPYLAYPDNKCGPDAVQFVEQYALQEDQWVQTGIHGVVFYQDKYDSEVNVKEAKQSIDPALTYHVNRNGTAKFEPEGTAIPHNATKQTIDKATELKNKLKPLYDEFLKSLNDFVVFRIVVSGKAEFPRAGMPEFVSHTRTGNTRYKYDCVMVVHGESQMVEVFGKEFGKIVVGMR